MTQRDLAGADLSVSFISMMEHDKVRPSLDTLRLLAERLGASVASLFEAGANPAAVEAMLRSAQAYLQQHQFTPALEQFETALGAAARLGVESLSARAHLGLGQTLMGVWQFDLAADHLEKAERIAGPDEPLIGARVANARGLLATRARDFPQARAHLLRALDLVRRAQPSDRELEARILANLGRVYTDLGLPLQAMACFEDARPAFEAAADPNTLALLHFSMGQTHLEQRAYEEAAHHLRLAVDLFAAQENLQLLGSVKRSLGMLMLQQGQAGEAESVLRQSLSIAEQMADDAGKAQTLTELARAALALGRLDEADGLAEEALGLAERLGDAAEATRARAVRGNVARRRGLPEDGAAHLREAVDAFTRLEMTRELADALRDLGFACLEAGREGAAAQAFARAFTAQPAAAAGGR